MTKIAIIQRPPVLLDRGATITRAVQWVAEAAAAGASLIVFPESFIPGYPSWIWRLAAGRDGAVMGQLHARLLANAVDVSGGDLAELCEAARAHNVTIVCGINERDRERGGGTLYNTVVTIGADGRVQNRHRKLMPTNPERMVHGLGDASGLRVVDTPAGRIGCLICWENYMPLARYMRSTPRAWRSTSRPPTTAGTPGSARCAISRSKVGAGWSVAARRCVPVTFRRTSRPAQSCSPIPRNGSTTAIRWLSIPWGRSSSGPLRREAGILYAEIDTARVAPSRRTLDVTGHYARPDIFELQVRRAPATPVLLR
ncbi:carbon-nitrogen hydrolase family protein [Polaromonas sp. P1(28)-8]|nr:carbon-nitrogen hydrolase family protein [Polaromonas sp. P1(28)-8]